MPHEIMIVFTRIWDVTGFSKYSVQKLTHRTLNDSLK